jgi:hypothetical protein
MGPSWFSQEYECEFVAPDAAVFSMDDIHAAFRRNIEPWDDLAALWHGQSS